MNVSINKKKAKGNEKDVVITSGEQKLNSPTSS